MLWWNSHFSSMLVEQLVSPINLMKECSHKTAGELIMVTTYLPHKIDILVSLQYAIFFSYWWLNCQLKFQLFKVVVLETDNKVNPLSGTPVMDREVIWQRKIRIFSSRKNLQGNQSTVLSDEIQDIFLLYRVQSFYFVAAAPTASGTDILK